MFLAIIIPPARKNRVVAVLVMLSFALSFACGCLPGIGAVGAGEGRGAASHGGRRGSRVGIHFDERDWATGKGLREAELRSKFTDSLQARTPSVGRNIRLAEYFFRR